MQREQEKEHVTQMRKLEAWYTLLIICGVKVWMGEASRQTREIIQSQVLKQGLESDLDSEGSRDGHRISVKDTIIFVSYKDNVLKII